MQYSFVAMALFAGAAFAAETATVYDTEVFTVTSCGPEITNCPARSHSATESSAWVESTTIASTYTPVETTSVPVAPYPTASTVTSVGPTASAPSASGTGSWGSTPSSPVPYKGAATSVKAAGLLIGAGAIAAFFL